MPIVCNELLGRPLLKIYQDTDAFNFSIDSMLLAIAYLPIEVPYSRWYLSASLTASA